MITLLKASQGPLFPDIFINPNRIISVSEGKNDVMRISYDCGSGDRAEAFISRESLLKHGLLNESYKEKNKPEFLSSEFKNIRERDNVIAFS